MRGMIAIYLALVALYVIGILMVTDALAPEPPSIWTLAPATPGREF